MKGESDPESSSETVATARFVKPREGLPVYRCGDSKCSIFFSSADSKLWKEFEASADSESAELKNRFGWPGRSIYRQPLTGFGSTPGEAREIMRSENSTNAPSP